VTGTPFCLVGSLRCLLRAVFHRARPASSRSLCCRPVLFSPAVTSNASKPGQKHADDIVIVSALRTMMGRARRGGLKDTPVEGQSTPGLAEKASIIIIGRSKQHAHFASVLASSVHLLPSELLATVLKATVDRTKIDPALIGDICVGTVLGGGSQRANECRIASFLAGLPDSVPIHTVNRQCSSGLQALAHVAANINAGFYEIGIAAGVESMSRTPFAWEGGVRPHDSCRPQVLRSSRMQPSDLRWRWWGAANQCWSSGAALRLLTSAFHFCS
jgi:acetyl-CoA acetyltransferase